MKKYILIPIILLLAACTNKEKMATEPCSFQVTVKKVAGTKVWLDIVPANDAAYYAFGMVDEGLPYYDMDVHQLAEASLEAMHELYTRYSANRTNVGSFLDFYCYREARQIKETHLQYDWNYRLLLIQVNPKDLTMIGEPVVVDFHTGPVDFDPDFTIDFKCDGSKLILTPSNLQADYYWDFEDTAVIKEEYDSPEMFFYDLVDMNEDYEFMPNMIDRGVCEYDLALDRGIEEGVRHTIVAAGYKDGEINTFYIKQDFIFEEGLVKLVSSD